VGKRLKKRRLERHLLQSEVAKLLGVSRNSVQNWEHGVHEPTTGVVPKIVEFLGYDPRGARVEPIPR
jgi:putative transcriptional regulator